MLKKLVALMISLFAVLAISSCGTAQPKQELPAGSLAGKKVLVAYFSQTGHTKYVAEKIAEKTGGDLFEITPAEAYPDTMAQTIIVAKRETANNFHPPITSFVRGIDQYDVVFIGYPIWWFDAPMIIHTFADHHPLSGKIVIPFSTAMSSGNEASVTTLRGLFPEAKVLSGWCFLRREDVEKEMEIWLPASGF